MDTIAAISTPQGIGGIGIVRISGKNAFVVAEKIFKPCDIKSKISKMKGYTAKLGDIIDENDKIIDEAIALFFRAPYSYTGENVVEFSCHGGFFITKKILRLVLNAGAELATAGEFTKRAFLNGKIDLSQAEAIVDLISAKNEKANNFAVSLKKGQTNKKINKIKDKFLKILAQISYCVDYSDEIFTEIDFKNFNFVISKLKSDMENLIKNFDAAKIIKNGVKAVIVGAPNVGKSTFMNFLTDSEKSIVTEFAGTTRDVIEESIFIGDIPLVLSDTAGIRETNDFIEKLGVEKAKNALKTADLIFFIVDSSKNFSIEEKTFLNTLNKKKVILVLNKTDLPKKIKEIEFLEITENVVSISAKAKIGRVVLEKAVYKALKFATADSEEIGTVTNERQFNILKKVISATKEAQNAVNCGVSLDVLTVLLQNILEIFLELTGETASEAVIDEVFSKFCVGK